MVSGNTKVGSLTYAIILVLLTSISCSPDLPVTEPTTPQSPAQGKVETSVSDQTGTVRPKASAKTGLPFALSFTLPDETTLRVDSFFAVDVTITSQSDHPPMKLRFEVSGALVNKGKSEFETHPLHANGAEQVSLVMRVTGPGASALRASLYPRSEDPDVSHVLSKSFYIFGEGDRVWLGQLSPNNLELRALDDLLDTGEISTEEHSQRNRKIRSGGAVVEIQISPPSK